MSTFIFSAVASTKTHKTGGDLTSPDMQNNLPIQFTVLAGTAPSRAIVLNGTVAKSLGIEANSTYLLQATFKEHNAYGDNFQITNCGKLDVIQMLDTKDRLGAPNVVQTENGRRIGVKVEDEVSAENGMD